MEKVSMMQIPESALLPSVVLELKGREAFTDTDATLMERIYTGEVFEAILGEQGELKKGFTGGIRMSKKALNQLEELAKLVDTDYVQITNIQ